MCLELRGADLATIAGKLVLNSVVSLSGFGYTGFEFEVWGFEFGG